jgi:hypothetical protein
VPLPPTAHFCGKCGEELRPAAEGWRGESGPGRLVLVLAAVALVLGTAGAYLWLRPSTGASPAEQSAVTPAAPAPVRDSTPTATPAPTPRDEDAVLAAVQGHWDAVREHRFEDAYAYLGPDLGFDESQWVASHESDGISGVRYQFSVRDIGFDTATVDIVVLQTTAQSAESAANPTGCLSWTGSYELIEQGDRWLIDQAHLTSGAC